MSAMATKTCGWVIGTVYQNRPRAAGKLVRGLRDGVQYPLAISLECSSTIAVGGRYADYGRKSHRWHRQIPQGVIIRALPLATTRSKSYSRLRLSILVGFRSEPAAELPIFVGFESQRSAGWIILE